MRNLIGGATAIAIGGAYLFMALGIRHSSLDDSVGPAGFPKILGVAMVALGAILCLQALWAMQSRRPATPAGAVAEGDLDAGARRAGWHGALKAGGMLLLGVGYLLIVRTLGYLPSIALLIFASTLYLGTNFSWRAIAIAVGGAVVYWLVFDLLLGIPQPPGLLGGVF